MARIRTVKPEYHQNRKTRKVRRDARLLNIGMWNIADDKGRLQELANTIIGAVFPTDEDVTPGVLREWLEELSEAGLIIRYEVDGERYIQIHDWHDHQRIDKPQKSVLPAPEQGLRVVADDSQNDPGTVPEAVGDESQGEGKGREGSKEGKGKESSGLSPSDAHLSHYLADLIAENDPDGKRPTVTQRWATEEDRMIRLDGRKPEEAKRLIEWTQRTSTFWRANCRSMPTFREKYGQLYANAVAEAEKRKGQGAAQLSPAEKRAAEVRRRREEREAA